MGGYKDGLVGHGGIDNGCDSRVLHLDPVFLNVRVPIEKFQSPMTSITAVVEDGLLVAGNISDRKGYSRSKRGV